MNKYKYAVFDIDGTLNEHGNNFYIESIEAIKKLQDKKLKILYASGKHPWYITGLLTSCRLLNNDTIIIGENGGIIFNPKTKQSFKLGNNNIRKFRNKIINNCSEKNGYLIYKNYELWEEPKETIFTLFVKNKKNVKNLESIFKKIIKQKNLEHKILTFPDCIDIIDKNINKSTALSYLSKKNKFKLSELISFGDDLNDYEMLRDSGYSIAVGNSNKKIKRLVKNKKEYGYVCKKNVGKGVLEAVNKLIINKII